MRALLLAGGAALTCATGCVAALPGSRTDVGGTLAGAGGPALHVAAGVHSASLTRRRVVNDIGAGYVYELGQPPLAGDTAWSLPPREPVRRQTQGAYVEASHAVEVHNHRRIWIGGRGEVLDVRDGGAPRAAVGAAVRVGWELYAPASGVDGGSSRCGFAMGGAYGAIGVGAFFEAGARAEEGKAAAFLATAGLSLRLPSMAGFAIDFCP